LEALLADVEAATDSPIKPILHYVKKLTLSPARISPADADAVFAAGWHDRALHDAVRVCALFNMMNRLVEGLGVRASGEYFALAGRRLHAGGYSGLKALLPSQS
jgi:alkylhydroperoxidase family enzyme